MRASKNMEKVCLLISNTVTPMAIDSRNLKLENLQTLSNNQVKYIKLLYKEGMLSEKAVLTIEEFIKTSIKSNDETIMVSDEDLAESYHDTDNKADDSDGVNDDDDDDDVDSSDETDCDDVDDNVDDHG